MKRLRVCYRAPRLDLQLGAVLLAMATCASGCHAILPLEPGRRDSVGPGDSVVPGDSSHGLDATPATEGAPDLPLDRGPLADSPATCTHVAGTTTKAALCLSASPPPGSVSVWPVAAGLTGSPGFPAAATCDWIDGTQHPAVGADAANWFVYGGCGDWKEYAIGAGCQLRVMSYSNGCPPQGVQELAEVMGVVEEWDGATWHVLRTIEHGTVTKSCTQVFEHPPTPITPSFFLSPARVRVRQTDEAASGFLICVYSL